MTAGDQAKTDVQIGDKGVQETVFLNGTYERVSSEQDNDRQLCFPVLPLQFLCQPNNSGIYPACKKCLHDRVKSRKNFACIFLNKP